MTGGGEGGRVQLVKLAEQALAYAQLSLKVHVGTQLSARERGGESERNYTESVAGRERLERPRVQSGKERKKEDIFGKTRPATSLAPSRTPALRVHRETRRGLAFCSFF